VPHGKRRAAACIAVGLGEHDAREVERRAEGPCRIHRVLARHAVDDEQRLDRLERGAELAHLGHHLLVDVQAARGIDEQRVIDTAARLFECARGDGERLLARARRRNVDAELRTKALELQHRSRATHVRRDEQHALALALPQPQRDLGRGRGLARALQAGEQDDRRRLRAQVDRAHALAHHAHQLFMDDAHQRLAGRQALVDLESDRARPDGLDELLDHRQRDVRLKQRHAHLPQGIADVLLGEPAAATQAFDDGRESGGELVEHGGPRRCGAAWAAGRSGIIGPRAEPRLLRPAPL